MVSVESEPVLGHETEPPVGPRGRALVKRLGAKPMKLNAFLRYHNLGKRQTCPKIRFLQNKTRSSAIAEEPRDALCQLKYIMAVY